MKDKLLTLGGFDRAKAWIEAALQDLQRTLAQHDVHVYRELTGTAAVTATPYTHAKWNVVDESVTEYRDGMIVCVKVPVAGNGSYGTGLQINSLGYKPVVFNVNSMIGTRYSVGAVVWAVYNSTQTASMYVNSASASTITGCWQVMDYDTNTTSIYTLQRYNGTRVVSADLLRYVIAFRKNETTIVPIHSVAGTGTAENTAVTTANKTMTTESFDPFGEIYQYATNTKIAANGSVNLSTLRTQCASVDARYIFNCNKTLTAQRELYLVVDLQSDGMVKLATSVNPWAQTLPSTNDGHLYILLGYAYSTYQMELYYYHPIYYHDGTQLRQYRGDKTFSGNYNDLNNKPTNVSAFINDVGYVLKTAMKGIGMLGANGLYVSDDVTFSQYGDSIYSSEFILLCGETRTYSGSNRNVYRLDGSNTGYIFDGSTPTIGKGIYKARVNDTTLERTPYPDASGVSTLINNAISSIEFPTELPAISSGDVGKVLTVNSTGDGVGWQTPQSGGGGGGLSDYDFTHVNPTVSGSTATITFSANQRGSAMMGVSSDIGLTIACNNGSDNYIWVKNIGSAEIDVTINAVTKNGTTVSYVYVPSDGITVPAGGVCEIGVIVNSDGAFITSRNDLAL